MKFYVAMIALVVSILGLTIYHIEQEVNTARNNLRNTEISLKSERQQIQLLRAEWSYLNTPARLQTLSAKHFETERLEVSQILDANTIPFRNVRLDQIVNSTDIASLSQ